MSKQLATSSMTSLVSKLADRFAMNGSDLMETLKATAFKGPVTDAQMTALLVVANQYGLNPWTREIYAFPDKNNGIVPVVGVDGWSRIINEHGAFDGMEFIDDEDAVKCTCIMYRKDRSRPIKITEYMAECRRENAQPWKTHPRRMLRHKAMIQCARLAFGFTGIYDQDEAERIVERDVTAQGAVVGNDFMPKAKEPATEKPAKKAKKEPEPEAEAEEGEFIPAEQPKDDGPRIQDNHAKMLRAKMTATGKQEADLCDEFGVPALESLAFSRLNDALKWAGAR